MKNLKQKLYSCDYNNMISSTVTLRIAEKADYEIYLKIEGTVRWELCTIIKKSLDDINLQ